MPITLEDIKSHLEKAEVGFEVVEEHGIVVTGSPMDSFVDSDGEKQLTLVIDPIDDGNGLAVRAPRLYKCPDGPNALATMKAVAHATTLGKYVEYRLDLDDDVISAAAEIPVRDGTITFSQFMTLLGNLVRIIDTCDPMIRRAIEKGEVVPPDPEEGVVTRLIEEIGKLSPNALIRLKEGLDLAMADAEAEEEKGEDEPESL